MTQPKFAPIEVADEVRPSYELETAPPWFAHRPGESGQTPRLLTKGFGVPGPDQGYALRLARTFRDQVVLGSGEYEDDAICAVVAVALRRAARFGRAPVRGDIEFGLELFGFLSVAPTELVTWRRRVIGGVAHDYRAQRELVGAVPEETFSLRPEQLHEKASDWQVLVGQSTPA